MCAPWFHRDNTVFHRRFAAFFTVFAGDFYTAAMVESFDSRRAS